MDWSDLVVEGRIKSAVLREQEDPRERCTRFHFRFAVEGYPHLDEWSEFAVSERDMRVEPQECEPMFRAIEAGLRQAVQHRFAELVGTWHR